MIDRARTFLPAIALIASLASLALIAGCTRAAPDATPEGVVRLWLDTMDTSQEDPRATREAFDLLGPAARANLEERAARASNAQGRRVEPLEMLAEGRFGLRFRPKSMTTHIEGAAGEYATVEVLGDAPATEHAIVHCTRIVPPSAGTSGSGASASGQASGQAIVATTPPGNGKSVWRVEPELPEVMTPQKRSPDAPDNQR